MKILVTGGSGFLGSHVADALSKKGHQVTIFDKKKSVWKRSDQKISIGNIVDSNALERVIKKVDAIYHFAGLANLDIALKEPLKSVNYNILGTVKTLELAKKYNIKRFIHASTIYVNSKEGGFYRCSKKAAEDYVEEYFKTFNMNYTILRFGSLYGPRSDSRNGVKKIVKNAIFKGKVAYDGTKNSIREYIHVHDAARACVDILNKKYNNKHIIITGKKKIKIKSFLNNLSKKLNIKNRIKYQNKKPIGHYTVTPFTFKPKKGEKFFLKSNIDFYKGLTQLINELKKENRR